MRLGSTVMRRRIEALERLRPLLPAVYIIRGEDETTEEAIAAWEKINGPVGDRFAIVRVIVSGVPSKHGRQACD